MANSAIVGTLKILLTANTAEFETAMKGVGKDLDALGGKATSFGGLVRGLGPMLAGAFTIGAITKLTGDFVEMSGKLVDLEAKTGLSVGALQRLKLATEQSGVGLDTVAAASVQLSKRLGEGKDSTLGALTAVGLKYEEIRALSPEDQFFTIADALGKIGDQNDKVALTNQLLGKQGNELLPALNGHLRETAAAYERMGLVLTDDVIRAGDELGDQWLVLKSVGTALLAQVIGPMVPGLVAISKEMTHLASIGLPALRDGFNSLIEASLRAQVRLFEFATAGAEVAAKMPTLRTLFGESAQDVAYFKNQTQIARDTLAGFVASGVEPANKALGETGRSLTAASQQQSEHTKAAIKGVDDRTAALRQFYNWLGEREIEDVTREQQALERKEEQWREYYNFIGERRMEDDAAAEKSRQQQEFAATAKSGTPLVDGFHAAVPQVRATVGPTIGAAIMGGLGDVFKNQLGPTVMAALTGGGSVTNSIGGLIGQSLGGSLAKSLGGVLSSTLGKTLGGALGSMLPGIGALAGPLIGKGLEKLIGLFGVSPAIKQSRTELEAFQTTLRGNLTETQKQEAGNEAWKMDVIAVRDAYLATGRSADAAMAIVKQLWSTDDPAKSKAAIEEINRVLKEQGVIAADNEATAAAATKAQEEAAAARAAELDDLKGKLAELKDEAEVDWNDMAAAAKKYGIDVDSLGPKFQGQRIAANAQDIVDTFDMLTENGASVGGVLFGMREEINALVKDALKFGTELPANMKPWIDELVRSGNLVDENGAALTDVSKLQFGKPVESKLDSVNRQIEEVTQKIEDLTSKIGDDLVAAFEKIPENINVAFDITFNDPTVPGGVTLTRRPPAMAEGGIVTAPTLALIGEGHQPEAVIPLDRLRGGLGSREIVVLPFIPITDPYAAAEEGARQFARRVGGDSHGMREVLEQVIDDWMRTYSPVRA